MSEKTKTIEYIICQDESIIEFAKDIKTKCGLSNRDAIHIASACRAKASFFLTCDDELVKKARSISKALQTKGCNINIANPMDFIQVYTHCRE